MLTASVIRKNSYFIQTRECVRSLRPRNQHFRIVPLFDGAKWHHIQNKHLWVANSSILINYEPPVYIRAVLQQFFFIILFPFLLFPFLIFYLTIRTSSIHGVTSMAEPLVHQGILFFSFSNFPSSPIHLSKCMY